jgi:hypothetical protein
MELANIKPALMALPSITVVMYDKPWRSLASITVSLVDTATSRIPPPAAVARTRRSAIIHPQLEAM